MDWRKFLTKEIIFFSLAVIFIFCYLFFLSAPDAFPAPSLYELSSGKTVSLVAQDFSDHAVIRSPFLFKSFVYLFSLGKMKIVEGDYTFSTEQNVIVIAWRLAHGDLETKPIKITIPEGLNAVQIADIYAKYLPSFSTSTFLALVNGENVEGYLFPDTYYFMPDTTEVDIINLMNSTFKGQIQKEASAITAFGRPQSDIITMASILEKEAKSSTDQRIISGILWKRLTLGMQLEVDSAPDTYTKRGLPAMPISNPGLESIMNAVTPTQTPYLYFLSDSSGNMHYATTLAGQDANEAKYLK